MLYGGIADRIVRFANSLVGHVRGGLGMSNVIGCTLFGGVAGSPLADVSAMGSVMIPLMKKEGYHADYAVNVTTHAALVGALMPTSHNLIIFTLATTGIASVSVFSLILAGVIPALILTLCNLAAAYWVAIKRGYPTHGAFPGWGAVLAAFLARAAGLVDRGHHPGRHLERGVHRHRVGGHGRLLGFARHRARVPVAELGALSQSLRQGLQDHRRGASVDWHQLGLSATSWRCTKCRRSTGELMKMVSTEPWVIFLMINVLLFVLGTFLDMAATILICTPIFLPIAVAFGMDPVQFGIMLLINCALGLNTPPVGTVQFVGCAIGGISVGEVMKSILPFYGALTATMMLVTYVPAFSMWLPGLFK